MELYQKGLGIIGEVYFEHAKYIQDKSRFKATLSAMGASSIDCFGRVGCYALGFFEMLKNMGKEFFRFDETGLRNSFSYLSSSISLLGYLCTTVIFLPIKIPALLILNAFNPEEAAPFEGDYFIYMGMNKAKIF
jgi:hypothetical protein